MGAKQPDKRYAVTTSRRGDQYQWRVIDPPGMGFCGGHAMGHAPDENTARDCAELVKMRLEGRDVRGELGEVRRLLGFALDDCLRQGAGLFGDCWERACLLSGRYCEPYIPRPECRDEARAGLAALRERIEARARELEQAADGPHIGPVAADKHRNEARHYRALLDGEVE